MQLSVIIVNFNVKYFLEQCLLSVIKAAENISAEIFVVDNNSSDGSRDFFAGKFPQVNFTWNQDNVGFAKANNQVIQQCSGEYILFLNPDTILPEDCFEKSIGFLHSKKSNGALGIRMIDGSGEFLKESKRGFPSPLTSLYKLLGLCNLFPNSKIFARYYLGHLDKNTDHEVDVLAGAFMMIPKKILDTTGSFDEDFFMYGEDIDLSYRIQKAGFKNYYFSGSTIIHFKGESTSRESIRYVRMFYKAMALFVKKHYHGTSSWIYNIIIQFAIRCKAFLSAFRRITRSAFSSLLNSSHKNKQPYLEHKIFVVGDDRSFTNVSSLLKKAGYPAIILGRINSDRSIENVALLNSLSEILIKQPETEILFCEDEQNFKDIILVVQQLKNTAAGYMFHANGSSTIIGSNDKNSEGFYIAASS